MSSEISKDRIQLSVVIDGSPARKELAELRQAARSLGTEQAKLNSELNKSQKILSKQPEGSAAYKAAAENVERFTKDLATNSAALRTNQDRQAELRQQIGTVGLSLNELRARALELRRTMAAGVLNKEALETNARELAEVELRMKAVSSAHGRELLLWEEDRKGMDLARMSLNQLNLELERWKIIQDTAQPGSAIEREAQQAISATTNAIKERTNVQGAALRTWEEERKGIERTAMSLEQLALEQERYRAIIANPATSGEDRSAANRDLAEVNDRIEQLTKSSRIAADEWARMRGQFKLDDLSIEQLKLEKEHLEGVRSKLSQTAPELGRVEHELLAVDKALETATKQTALYERQWERTRKDIRLSDMSIQELEREIKYLNGQMANVKGTDIAGLTSLRHQANAAERQLAKLRSGLGPLGQAWQQVKGQVVGAGAVLGTLFAGGAIFQGIRNLITGAGKVSDELADVQKASGLSAAGVRQLNTELGRIDTRTASADLREIAVGLGQAGEEVTASAVESIDRINVALGDEFGEGSREVATILGVLRNGFADIKTENFGEDVLHIGNALNLLGASGRATAPVVSDIAKRVSGAATQYKIASGDVLGLAATFQELGINTERGSTAYVRVLNKIAGEPQKFAAIVKAAGLDVQQFSADVNNNLQAAFVTAAKAANIAGASNTDFAAILGDLGTEGVGVSELLSKIGQNSELLAQKSKLAGDALKDTTSILDEFALKNNTLQGQLDKLGKEFARIFSSSTVQDAVRSIVTGLANLFEWLRKNTDTLATLGGGLLRMISLWAGFRAGSLLASTGMRVWDGLLNGYIRLTANGANAISLFTGAFKGLGIALRANPIGAAITGINIAIQAYQTLAKHTKDAAGGLHDLASGEREQLRSATALYGQILLTNQGTEQRRSLIEKLKAIYPSYLQDINAETASNQQLTVSLQNVVKQLINKAVIARQEAANAELQNEAADAMAERLEAESKAWDRMRDLAAKYGIDLAAATENATSAYDAVQKFDAFLKQALKRGGGTGFYKETLDVSSLVFELAEYKAFYENKERIALAGEQKIAQMKKDLGIVDAPTTTTSQPTGAPSQNGTATPLPGSPNKKAEESYKTHLDAIKKLLNDHQEDMYESLLSADNRELFELNRKNAEEIAQLEVHQAALIQAGKLTQPQADEQILQLEQIQGQKELALIRQQGERRRQARADVDALYLADREAGLRDLESIQWQAHQDALQDEVDKWMELAEEAQYGSTNYYTILDNLTNARKAQNQANEQTEVEAEAAAWDARITKLLTQGALNNQALQSLEEAKGSAIDRIRRKWAKKADKDDEEDHRKRRERMQKELQGWSARLQAFSGFAGAMSNLYGTLRQVEEQKADADGVRTAEEVERINRLEKRRIAWAKAEIALNTAIGIINAVRSGSEYGYPWGLVITALGIASVLAGAAQAWAQLGTGGGGSAPSTTSAGQPSVQNVPLGEKGFPALPRPSRAANGVPALQGPSHAQGGLDVVDTTTGRTVANIEGGEAVVNKDVTAANPELIGALMNAAHRSNKRVDAAAVGWRQQPPRTIGDALERGMPISGASTAPQPPNPQRVTQAFRQIYAMGGIIPRHAPSDTTPAASTQQAALHLEDTNALLRALLLKTDENTDAVRRYRKVVFSPNPQYDRTMDDWERRKARHRTTR